MKIYTKTGDSGKTSLSDGSRVSKSSNLLHAYGTIDELNAFLGLLISEKKEDFLTELQNLLFVIGGMLATPADLWENYYSTDIIDTYVQKLENAIDEMSAELPPFRGFILPQGNTLIAHTHICRTVCRRAEREVVGLMENDNRYQSVQILLNRLSDYFFVLARFYHKNYDIPETIYKSIQ